MAGTRRRRYPHLPDGHLPGRQSRSRYGLLAWFLLLLAILLCLFFVGLGVALVVGAGSAESASGSYIGAAVLGIPGVAGTLFMVWLIRRRFAKPVSHLRLDVHPLEVSRGQPVTARLTINDLAKVGDHELRVGLVCTEWYDLQRADLNPDTAAITRTVTESSVAYEQWTTIEHTAEPQAVTLQVPPDAPFSYEGTVLTYAWRVTARELVRRRTDPTVDVPIWVTP
jgi:flagellar biogenesis protein FliO